MALDEAGRLTAELVEGKAKLSRRPVEPRHRGDQPDRHDDEHDEDDGTHNTAR